MRARCGTGAQSTAMVHAHASREHATRCGRCLDHYCMISRSNVCTTTLFPAGILTMELRIRI